MLTYTVANAQSRLVVTLYPLRTEEERTFLLRVEREMRESNHRLDQFSPEVKRPVARSYNHRD